MSKSKIQKRELSIRRIFFQTTDDNPKGKKEIRSRTKQSLKHNLSNTKKKYGITEKLRKPTSKKRKKNFYASEEVSERITDYRSETVRSLNIFYLIKKIEQK